MPDRQLPRPKRSNLVRLVLGFAVAAVTALVLTKWISMSSDAVRSAAFTLNVGGPLSEAGAMRPPGDPSARFFYWFLIVGVALAAGMITTILLLYRTPGFVRRTIVYLSLLAVAGPLTWLNYNLGDLVLPRFLQWGLDLYVIAIGALCIHLLGRLPSPQPDLRIFKLLAIALLACCAVAVPSFFALLWLMDALGVVSPGATRAVSWVHLTGAGALVSAVVAALNYKRELRKDAVQAQRL
jgi:hypothetical protein